MARTLTTVSWLQNSSHSLSLEEEEDEQLSEEEGERPLRLLEGYQPP
jgi:hypothetical protein